MGNSCSCSYCRTAVVVKSKPTIHVASENPDKLNAVKHVFDKYLPEYLLVGCPVSSGVPEQPFNHETILGAMNRLYALESKSKGGGGTINVSFENGIFFSADEKTPYDACIVCLEINGKKTFRESRKTYIPMKYVNECIKSNQQITVGSIIEFQLQLPKGKWHEHFGKFSRVEIMEETLLELFAERLERK